MTEEETQTNITKETGGEESQISLSIVIESTARMLKIPIILSIILTVAVYIFTLHHYIFSTIALMGILFVVFIICLLVISFIMFSPKPRYYYYISIMTGDYKSTEKLPFKHDTTNNKSYPYSGSSPIIINGKTHMFIGGSKGQNDALLLYNEKTKEYDDIIGKTNLSDKSKETLSAASFDFNGDGRTDLIIGRTGEVAIYLQDSTGYQFTKRVVDLPEDKVPLALSISDFNKDGRPDIYISYFIPRDKFRGAIFNDPSHNRDNVLLMGLGDTKFKDVTVNTNSQGKSNTFTSAWVDIDKDSYPDLVLAHDSHEPEILRNLKGKGFESIIPHDGKGNYMGIGVGDIDGDGDQDIIMTNIGTDFHQSQAATGDIRKDQKQEFKHILLRNDGKFKFTEISEQKGITGDGFGWGAVIEDLNHDGKLDILFGENFFANIINYIIPGVAYYYEQDSNNKFQRKFTYQNNKFNQTPMLADTKGDKIKDIVWVNMGGQATIQQRTKNDKGMKDNNYINVLLPETTEFVNAKVIATLGNKKELYGEIIQGGQGFGGDQDNMVTFGLGKETRVKEVRVYTMYNREYSVKNPQINSTLTLKELK